MYGARKSVSRRGRCPHCNTGVQLEPEIGCYIRTPNEAVQLWPYGCPSCGRIIVVLVTGQPATIQNPNGRNDPSFINTSEYVVWPAYGSRPVPDDVPEPIAIDYKEASAVLEASPKASAALSRRCLQAILRDKGFNHKELWQQIAAARSGLPGYIADNIEAIRHVGNFAAHPGKDQATGDIIEVEPGEAEWLLSVLEELFQFYYVAPAQAKANRDAINAKLQAVGKQPMK